MLSGHIHKLVGKYATNANHLDYTLAEAMLRNDVLHLDDMLNSKVGLVEQSSPRDLDSQDLCGCHMLDDSTGDIGFIKGIVHSFRGMYSFFRRGKVSK